MHVRIISPEESVYDGDADTMVAPAFDGQIGILPRHAPLMTLLGEGPLTLKTGGSEQVFDVRGGFMQVVNDTVSVVAEHAQTRERGAK